MNIVTHADFWWGVVVGIAIGAGVCLVTIRKGGGKTLEQAANELGDAANAAGAAVRDAASKVSQK